MMRPIERALISALSLTIAAGVRGASAQTSAEGYPLIPRPRELAGRAAQPLAGGVRIESAARGDSLAVRAVADMLRELGIRSASPGKGLVVRLLRSDSPPGRAALSRAGLRWESVMRGEGYALATSPGSASIIAATPAGIFYGAQTLAQLIDGRGGSARLRGAMIRDWPAMRYRGFHDDLSRGPVPTLEYQKKQIRTFAAYKINVYSPYFEHTLSYRSNPLIAPPGGGMTAEQVRELVAYARAYHIEVIPEQEAFGHLHHLLKYELYSPLGETPHGHVLAPGQAGSLPLIRQMFAEIDSLFPGRFIHLGADETFELGRGQSAERVRTEGIGAVYLDFLKQIEGALRGRDKRFLFWGDVAMNSPDLVKTLPKDLIPVAWDYDPAPSFDKLIAPFRDAGMETWVAPGVNSWNRVYPDFALALPNIQGFVRDGQRLGASGVLNTSWDDDGEALFAQSWYGVLFGAAAGWQHGESSIEDFQRSYGRVFHGDTSGRLDRAQRKLMAAHQLLRKAGVGDASDYLFWLDPWSDEGQRLGQKIRPVASELRVLAESAIVLVADARRAPLRETDALDAMDLGARRIDLIGMKFQFAEEIAQMYARAADSTSSSASRDLGDITGINGRLQDLRDAYSLVRDEYERQWLRENRPYWIHNVLARFDLATQLWISRADRIGLARQAWYRTKKLPPPEVIGVPTPRPNTP
ncbi:MAG: beta-N-acetylhexosaminidase [Gemmatimonadota bacterium]|nr:beta-N-acetylhexosaminidase [Gemmatimonadota bacterium]